MTEIGEVHAVLGVLAGRRSVTRFSDIPVERRDIELALDVGIRAPNHRRTRPWRFVVVNGDARHRLGEQMAVAAARMGQDVERARGKALIAPTIICAAVSPQLDRPKVLLDEEYLAVGAAIQNIMLALHARGVGSIWTTGALIGSDEVREFFGITASNDRILGLIYVGFSRDEDKGRSIGESHVAFTRWLE